MLYDCAVIIPTIVRPALARAVRSIFAQDFAGTVQILIGIDVLKGDRGIIDGLHGECPEHMRIDVLDLGYSTGTHAGGFYRVQSGGSLRTILSYAANSRLLAYLDDDNWWAPNHLSSLRRAIEGRAWAYSYRWYVDPESQEPLCMDRWESVGAGRGMYAHIYKYNGHVDSNCFMLDKRRCHWLLPAWSTPHPHSRRTQRRGAGGEDRKLFQALESRFDGACTREATVYYVTNENWLRVLKYLLNPCEPAALSDAGERRCCELALRLEAVAAMEAADSAPAAKSGEGQ